MTKTENEIIAEFMATDAINSPHKIPSKILAYDTSWDWLMPVVEKIERIEGVKVIIKVSRCRILVGKKVFSCHTISKINSMYRVVVEFIKWYNSNPTSS